MTNVKQGKRKTQKKTSTERAQRDTFLMRKTVDNHTQTHMSYERKRYKYSSSAFVEEACLPFSAGWHYREGEKDRGNEKKESTLLW